MSRKILELSISLIKRNNLFLDEFFKETNHILNRFNHIRITDKLFIT